MRDQSTIEITEYDSAWVTEFAALAERARAYLGDLVCDIEHIGSTAVPGLAAKPIVDFDVIVASSSAIAPAIARLARAHYVHEGDLGIKGREAFLWPFGEKRHHLYLLTESSPELQRHLAFRDALRSDPELRDRYAALKYSLAEQNRDDHGAYTAGKAEFVESVLNGT